MSFLEIGIIFLVGLVFIGPKQLPELAKTLGELWHQLSTFLDKAKHEFEHATRVEQLKENISLANSTEAIDTEQYEDPALKEPTLLDHLGPFRKMLLNIVFVVMGLFLILLYFANPLFSTLAIPLLSQLPEQSHIIATGIASPLTVPLKFTFLFAIFISMPYIFYQLWRFIAPGLHREEKHYLWLTVLSCTLLFYLGLVFVYFLVAPLLFGFFANIAPFNVTLMPDIQAYLSFILRLFFAFGIAFQVPVVVFMLVQSGLCSISALAAKRRYVVVCAFILGMFLTPPDVISQVLLAIPLWGLFELGLLAALFFKKND